MKEPRLLSIDDCLAQIEEFDDILDARSPSEFAQDSLPGARSTPVLDDAERALVGTLYRTDAFAAKRRGAALVARNIASILESLPEGLTRGWRPLIYCWRGGNRSGALGTVLARVGFGVTMLEGGYREFRRRVAADLLHLPLALDFRVLTGPTGSGKSALLQALAARGAQVLDLEGLASHRGSVLGGLPTSPQPAQKRFESSIWSQLRRFDARQPVYVESESKKIGQNHVPDAVLARIRAADCIRLRTSDAVRVALLCAEYRHFIEDPTALRGQLDCLVGLHGRSRVADWQALAGAGRWSEFVEAMLRGHYDPAYDRSMRRNFVRLEQGIDIDLRGADADSIAEAADAVLRAR